MPSPGHRLVTAVVPRLRGFSGPLDADAERDRLLAAQAKQAAVGPAPLPAWTVRGFDRRWEVEADDSAGFRTWVLTPKGRTPARTLLHVHGGGYTAGLDPFHLTWTTRVGAELDARVVLPDYPLAPTHTWRDSYDAMVALTTRHVTAARAAGEGPFVLSGDSAGGGYALAIARTMRDAGGPQADRLVLHAPWVDLSTSTPETDEMPAHDPWLHLGKLRLYAQWWAGSDDDLTRPEVSPVLHDLAGLPPAIQFHGTRDLLMPGCRLLDRRAAEDGWDLTSVEEPGLLHVYSLFPHFVGEARRAHRQTLDFVRPTA